MATMQERRNARFAAQAIEREFKSNFYDGMQRYAPVADGWLRSCGMFKVEVKVVGAQVVVALKENPNRKKEALYWDELEKGSTLPRHFRMWAKTRGRHPERFTPVVRQIFSFPSDTPGKRDFWYWERSNPTGRWEQARYNTHKVRLMVISDRRDPRFPRAGSPRESRSKFINSMYQKMRASVVGADAVSEREFWVSKRPITRKPQPFLSAVLSYAVTKTRAAIDAGHIATYGLSFGFSGEINEVQKLFAYQRAIRFAEQKWLNSQAEYRKASLRAVRMYGRKEVYARGFRTAEMKAWSKEEDRLSAIVDLRKRELKSHEEFLKSTGWKSPAQIREEARAAKAAERMFVRTKAAEQKVSQRDQNFNEWRQKMLRDPRAWMSDKLREWDDNIGLKMRDRRAFDTAKKREMTAFEKRFGFTPYDVGHANADEAGVNYWDSISKWGGL